MTNDTGRADDRATGNAANDAGGVAEANLPADIIRCLNEAVAATAARFAHLTRTALRPRPRSSAGASSVVVSSSHAADNDTFDGAAAGASHAPIRAAPLPTRGSAGGPSATSTPPPAATATAERNTSSKRKPHTTAIQQGSLPTEGNLPAPKRARVRPPINVPGPWVESRVSHRPATPPALEDGENVIVVKGHPEDYVLIAGSSEEDEEAEDDSVEDEVEAVQDESNQEDVDGREEEVDAGGEDMKVMGRQDDEMAADDAGEQQREKEVKREHDGWWEDMDGVVHVE
ncbi:hypothetical protein NKR19_g3436 [Coniochaeta hoffmannii]|uniref:Uncharacterized protein n=1 Tax=Coniochaeta hoffmannii TaxID=91930 RepID=A0AA38S3P4_9PEZI|nr:hypothetical protein NKR19_g3436 [Coniochaeta hoffmannii]